MIENPTPLQQPVASASPRPPHGGLPGPVFTHGGQRGSVRMTMQNAHRMLFLEKSSMPAAVNALAGAVTTEIRLLEELIGTMRRQRHAVATDDLAGVDDTVFATHRILVTLGEARRQRRSLCRLLAGTEDLALRLLEDALGDLISEELRFAMDGLRAVALTLSREVEMNRQLIRGALCVGDDYVRALYGSAEPAKL